MIIKTDEMLDAAIAQLDSLLAQKRRSPPQNERLEELTNAIEAYEKIRFPELNGDTCSKNSES